MIYSVKLTTIRECARYVLPTKSITFKICIQEGVPEIFHSPSPRKLQNLDKETGNYNTYPIMQPTSGPQLPHPCIDQRVTSSALSPCLKISLIYNPRKELKVAQKRPFMTVGVVETNVPRIFSETNRFKEQVHTLFTGLVSFVGPQKLFDADKMEDLLHTQLTKMQMGWEKWGCGTVSLSAIYWVLYQWTIYECCQCLVSIAPPRWPCSRKKCIACLLWFIFKHQCVTWASRHITWNIMYFTLLLNFHEYSHKYERCNHVDFYLEGWVRRINTCWVPLLSLASQVRNFCG